MIGLPESEEKLEIDSDNDDDMKLMGLILSILAIIIFMLYEDIESDEMKSRKRKLTVLKSIATRRENKFARIEVGECFQNSYWYRWYVAKSDKDNYYKEDPNDYKQKCRSKTPGNLFRTKFRLPFKLYSNLLERVKAAENDPSSVLFRKHNDACGHASYPVELFLLAALRILGRHSLPDCISEVTSISAESIRVWFRKFVLWYTKTQYERFVRLPNDSSEIEKIMYDYKLIGLPGFIGSMDGTVIPVMASYNQKMNYVGHKTQYTAVNVAFLVAHNMQILHVSPPFPSTCVDSMIQKLDYSVHQIQTNPMFTQHPVKFQDSSGNTIMREGVTILVDGGYPELKIFQTGGRDYCTYREGSYCACLESVRKDVERTFGVLKSRFKILKHGMRTSDHAIINCVIATCAGLHNELLIHDRKNVFDDDGTNRYVDYKDLEDGFVDDDLVNSAQYISSSAERKQRRPFDRTEVVNEMYQLVQRLPENSASIETYASRRKLLMDHWNYHSERSQIFKRNS